MGEQGKKEGKGAWWRRGWVLILGALVGVGLIWLGNGTAEDAPKQQSSAEPDSTLYDYVRWTEERIASLCSSVQGVSEARVAVSLSGDFSYVYATDSDTQEKEGTSERQEQYVTVGSGSSEQAVLLTRTPPAVSGIGVVCRGGGDARVRQELTALLSAAFGIGSNKIYIAEANP